MSWGWVVLTWGPFSVAIGLTMAADVALVVENGLNGVIVSNRGWWERWGNLPGLVDDHLYVLPSYIISQVLPTSLIYVHQELPTTQILVTCLYCCWGH